LGLEQYADAAEKPENRITPFDAVVELLPYLSERIGGIAVVKMNSPSKLILSPLTTVTMNNALAKKGTEHADQTINSFFGTVSLALDLALYPRYGFTVESEGSNITQRR
jgi:hypothetical protein